MTKTLIAIILLCTLLAPPLLVSGWFQLARAELRREARQQLLSQAGPGELVALSFTLEEAAGLNWERPDEFEFEGRMYDVMRADTLAGRVRYLCWPDEQETRLNKELRALTARLFHDAPEPKRQTGHLYFFFKSLYYAETAAWQPSAPIDPGADVLQVLNLYRAPALAIRPAPPRQG